MKKWYCFASLMVLPLWMYSQSNTKLDSIEEHHKFLDFKASYPARRFKTQWIVKTDLVAMGSDIPLVFEYRWGKNWSLEAGLGVTLGGDGWTKQVIENRENNNRAYVSKIRLGLAQQVSARFYMDPSQGKLQGLFVGFNWTHKEHLRRYVFPFEHPYRRNVYSGNIILGYQVIHKTGFTFCAFGGMGTRKRTLYQYKAKGIEDPNDYSSDIYDYSVPDHANYEYSERRTINIMMGIQIGWGR